MSKFTSFLRALLPVSFADPALKVEPAIQAQIDQLLHEAQGKINGLRAQHSLASKKSDVAQRRGWANAVFNDYERLLAAEETAAETAASAVLPPVAAQFGSTGVAGPAS